MTDNLPPTKHASDLEPGDWVHASHLHKHLEGVAQVKYAEPYAAYGTSGVTVVLSFGEGTRPETVNDVRVDLEVPIASAEAVATTKLAARRFRVAEQFRDLANLIVDASLPLPGEYRHPAVTFDFGRDVDRVAEVAGLLGLKVDESFGTTSVEWPAVHEPGLLTATWTAYSPKKAEAKLAASGLLHSREPDSTVVAPVPDHVDGHPEGRAAEHYPGADRVPVPAEDATIMPFVLRDRRTCAAPGEPERDHAMCGDVVYENENRHLVWLLGDTACGIQPGEIPESDGQTADDAAATCRGCREVLDETEVAWAQNTTDAATVTPDASFVAVPRTS